jgi:hypothetical protein
MSSTDEPNSFHSGGVVGQPELEILNDHFRVARDSLRIQTGKRISLSGEEAWR